MRSTCRRSNRKSHRNRRLTRRQKGGLVPNATAPKFDPEHNHKFFNVYGARHKNIELNAVFAKAHHKEIKNELHKIEEKHIVHSQLNKNKGKSSV
jgi:hypothetical protein